MTGALHNPGIGTLVSQFIASGDDKEASKVYVKKAVGLVENNDLTLLEFIQGLGPTITSESDMSRAAGMQFLAETLSGLSSTRLSKQDVNVFFEFLLSKLDDKSCLIHTFHGILSLIKSKNFIFGMNNNVQSILGYLLDKYNPRLHLAKVRYYPFNILKELAEKNIAYFNTASDILELFIKTFVHIASGEKDPRNLMISFNLNVAINRNLSLATLGPKSESLITDLYDVCFCYFPISFTPPANDPYKIGAGDLKLALREAISSQSGYAKDAFNDLLEKLTSTNPIVRNDVLKTMLLCVERYNDDTIMEYWETIWNGLKYEILHNDVSLFKSSHETIIPDDFDSAIDDTDEFKPMMFALSILSSLSGRLEKTHGIDNIIVMITQELEENLSKVDHKHFKQSILLLSSIASKSQSAFNQVISFLFSPKLLGKYIRSDISVKTNANEKEIDVSEGYDLNTAKKRDLIDNLGFLFISYKTLTKDLDSSSLFFFSNNLVMYKDHLLLFLCQSLQTASNMERTLKCKLIQQFLSLTLLPNYLNKEENTLFLNQINDILFGIVSQNENWNDDIVVKEIVTSLQKFMTDDVSLTSNVTMVVELLLPGLLELLTPDSHQISSPRFMANFKKTLTIINDLCVNYQFLEVLAIRILNKLGLYSEYSASSFELFQGLVALLVNCVKKVESSKQFLFNSWYKSFVSRFLSVLIGICEADQSHLSGEVVGDLLSWIIRFSEKDKHQHILKDFVDLFLGNSANGVSLNYLLLEEASPLISIFNKTFASIDRSCDLGICINVSPEVYIDSIIKMCHTCDDEYSRLGYLQHLSLYINKFIPASFDVGTYMKETIKRSEALFAPSAILSKYDVVHFEILIWSIKGLLVKLDKTGLDYFENVMGHIGNWQKTMRYLIPKAFKIFFVDLPIFKNEQLSSKQKVISGVQNLNVRLLYKQKIFEILVPKLIDYYLTADEEMKETCLVSLSMILKCISNAILKSHLSDILPLILSSLSLCNPVILGGALTTTELILKEAPNLAIPHLTTLTSNLTNLAVNRIVVKKTLVNTADIRFQALKCLQCLFESVDQQYTIAYRTDVLKSLVRGLEDPKRNVRKLSCDIRQSLYEMNN